MSACHSAPRTCTSSGAYQPIRCIIRLTDVVVIIVANLSCKTHHHVCCGLVLGNSRWAKPQLNIVSCCFIQHKLMRSHNVMIMIDLKWNNTIFPQKKRIEEYLRAIFSCSMKSYFTFWVTRVYLLSISSRKEMGDTLLYPAKIKWKVIMFILITFW